ncbi:MAG: cytochrome c biogenesis protein CcdA [Bacteroidota bacterium]|nr:cytochrome c biogenesis protein CcdA [Bacteroidota bacterium]
MNRIFQWSTVALLAAVPSLCFAQSPLADINTWVETQLSTGDNSITAYLFLLVGGTLASLLPCTYPLYPITVNILKSRTSSTQKFIHPLFYFGGIISMYFLFGIIASATGGAFNTVLRLPTANLVIAICIFLLGLSSIELLNIPIFSGASGESKNKGVFGTYLMGMGAGLLSSACVGPVVVSILIGIASQSNDFSINLATIAALKMLAFGTGLGLPFLLIGVFGLSLPKSGAWMKYAQLALGGLIVYFAYIYLDKALLGYGFSENATITISFGVAAIIIAAYYYQSDEYMPHQKMRKALLLLSGIVGSLVLMRAMIPQANTSTEAATIASPKTETKGELTWYLDKEEAYKVAKEKGKLVFVDFHADWCTNCKEFQKITQSNKPFNEALKNVILLKVYDTSPLFQEFKNDARFPELKVGLPFFLITDKESNLVYKTNDFLKTDDMMLFLNN